MRFRWRLTKTTKIKGAQIFLSRLPVPKRIWFDGHKAFATEKNHNNLEPPPEEGQNPLFFSFNYFQ